MTQNRSGSNPFSQVFKFLKPAPRSMSSRTAKKRAARAAKLLNNLPKPTAKKKPGGSKASPYQAASITSNDSACACDAVKAIEGNRFLSRDIPVLPLQDCTSPNCTCSYTRYHDRRGFNGDRRAIASIAASQIQMNRQGKNSNHRNQTPGRRTVDGNAPESLESLL